MTNTNTISSAIHMNDVCMLRSLLNEYYYLPIYPTISDKDVESYKLFCTYSNKCGLLKAFKPYPDYVHSTLGYITREII